MLKTIECYTRDELKFVAGALAEAGVGELGEILELKMSEGQEVEFEAECRTADGRVVSIQGTYDGSWNSYDCVSVVER